MKGCRRADSAAWRQSSRNLAIASTNGLLLFTLNILILLKRFSARMPDFVRTSRWWAADVCESPDLLVISEMLSSPLSIITVRILVLP